MAEPSSALAASPVAPTPPTVDVLKTSGDLYQHQVSDWAAATLLDQNVQWIWLTDGGYTLAAQDYDGTIAYFVA
jgi:hypothetical protein